MKRIRVSKKQLLTELWGLYAKQKAAEEETGVAVKSDMDRMRGWFRMALEERCTDKSRLELFGKDEHETDNPLACDKCGDTGWYFAHDASFQRRAPKGRVEVETEGMVVCFCAAGSQKNKTIHEINKKPEKKRGGGKFF